MNATPAAPLNRGAPRFGKPALSHSGGAVCGALGVEQHLGIWSVLFACLAWLIAADHAGYLLRRRYGSRVGARLSRRHPTAAAHRWVVGALQPRIGAPQGIGAGPYRAFAVINTFGALVWGSIFVSIALARSLRARDRQDRPFATRSLISRFSSLLPRHPNRRSSQ